MQRKAEVITVARKENSTVNADLDGHTDGRALRAEYCIVGIPHDTGI